MADIKPVVLVVDDELSIRESFTLILGKDFNVVTAASGEAALKRIIDEKVDLVYLDVRMPGMNGIETLKRIKEIDKNIDVIMVTAVNEVASAGAAVKLGAKDYIVKPFDVDEILSRTRNLIIKAHTGSINPRNKEELIGDSRQIKAIKQTLEESSLKASSVLIMAEKGLEGEAIAKIISGEEGKNLKTINISAHFKSSDLFGFEKGAFMEEFRKEAGSLEEANGGSLFIRNIELMPLESQVKLSLSLIKREMSREGSLSKIPVNVRVIAETSVNLEEMVKEEIFDKELYGIISKTIIILPSLREREGDIPILIDHYLELFNELYEKRMHLSEAALDVLAGYQWPGNLVELANTLEAIALETDKEQLEVDDLPLDIIIKSSSGGRPYTTLDNFEGKLEKAHILNIFNSVGHNREKASKLLGILQKNLESKLESYSS